MSNIVFPEGITWNQRYVTGGDFVPVGTELTTVGNLYRNAGNIVTRVGVDTSNVTDMSHMFNSCSALTTVSSFETSNVADMDYMFASCTYLTTIPVLDTSNVTSMISMFSSCNSLTTIPQLDTSNVTDMSYMFQNCSALTTIPQLDTSNVTNISYMFKGCSKLEELPDFNCVKVTNFGTSSSYSWLNGEIPIKKIGVVDCDSVTNINYFFGNYSRTYLVEFGGCRNLGKASSVSNTNGSYFMTMAPNLNYQSVMNVINLLYDRAANGLSTLTLKLHANHMAMLSEDDIAIATNKGWTLTA